MHARVLDLAGSDERSRSRVRPHGLPPNRQRRHPELSLFRGSMAGLHAPLPTLRRHPRECLRTARGRCGSLLLHRSGLAPPTPCRPPGAPVEKLPFQLLPKFPARRGIAAARTWRTMRSSAACDQERSDKRPDDLPSELLIATRPRENWESLQFGVFQQNRSTNARLPRIYKDPLQERQIFFSPWPPLPVAVSKTSSLITYQMGSRTLN